MFNLYASFSYRSADLVTSLFQRARMIQEDLGCQLEKCRVISNGIILENFINIEPKADDGWIDIGAVVRFSPIKDIKTLIYTFSSFKQEYQKARLHILGPVDDEDYYQECLSLISYLGVEDIILTGEVKTNEYIKKLDFTVLTSLSEGQPLSVIESLASARPVIATNVGCCRELLEGDVDDTLGSAGICVPPMRQSELLKAMNKMCRDTEMRRKMGVVGRQRAISYFDHKDMVHQYHVIYEEAKNIWQASGLN